MRHNHKVTVFCITVLISFTHGQTQNSTATPSILEIGDPEFFCANLINDRFPMYYNFCDYLNVTTDSPITTSTTLTSIITSETPTPITPTEGTPTEGTTTATSTTASISTTTTTTPAGSTITEVRISNCAIGEMCVPYYLCANDTIAESGSGLTINLNGSDNATGECPNGLEKCCSENEVFTRSDIPEMIETLLAPNITKKNCGYRNTEGINVRIIGNEKNETEFGEFPWMAAILLQEDADDKDVLTYRCGGSIIHPGVVITALHCVNVRKANEIVVRGGEWDLVTNGEHLRHQDRYVKEIIKHEKYYKGGFFNDIALLLLTEPFVMYPHIQPVCLPPTDTVFDGSRCFVTGWGTNSTEDNAKYLTILKKIDLPIVPNDQCQVAIRTIPEYNSYNLHESFICAGGELGKDACKGDGGSPLVCPIPNTVERYYLAGIVSWGIGCGQSGIPGFYASIPYLRSWIDEHFDKKSIDKSSFTV